MTVRFKHALFGCIAAAALLSAPLAFAHESIGQRFEQADGQYLVELGSDQESDFLTRTLIQFDYGLHAKSDGQDIPFTDADVIITRNGVQYFESELAGINDTAFLTFMFLDPGRYAMRVVIYDGMKQLAAADFPLDIKETGPSASIGSMVRAAAVPFAALCVGVVIGLGYGRGPKKDGRAPETGEDS